MGTVVSIAEYKARRCEWSAIASLIEERIAAYRINERQRSATLVTARRTWDQTHDVNITAVRATCLAAAYEGGHVS